MLDTTEQGQRPGEFGAPVQWRRLTLALWRRRWVVVCATAVGTAAGAAMAKTLVAPVFEAQSTIECDRCAKPEYGERELATLQETVKLPQHLENACEKLGLPVELESLDSDVEVNASLESRLIQVTARGKTGALAAELANMMVDAFIQTRLQIEIDILDQNVQRLLIDANKARAAIVEARENHDRFRHENNIVDLAAERQAAVQGTARLHAELAIAQADEQAERARALALHRATVKESSTAILQQTEELSDAKKLADVRSQLTEARVLYSAAHPQVLALRAQAEELERKIAEANEAIATGRTIGPNPQLELARRKILEANANQEAARTRQSLYEKMAHSTAEEATRLANIEGRSAELLFQLESAERHATSIALDLKAAQDAARAPSTGLRILARARAPRIPVESPRKVVAVLGPLVGFLFTVLFIVLWELRGIRIHTAAELTFWGKGPTIAASTWPRSPHALDDLAAELTESVRNSSGKTVILGASADELPYLEQLIQKIQEQMPPYEIDGARIESLPPLASTSALRQSLRDATRVLIMVTAGKHSVMALTQFVQKIAFTGQLGFVLVNLQEEYAGLPDLVGDVDGFWKIRRPTFRRRGKSNRRRMVTR